jgi:hypothetical protein
VASEIVERPRCPRVAQVGRAGVETAPIVGERPGDELGRQDRHDAHGHVDALHDHVDQPIFALEVDVHAAVLASELDEQGRYLDRAVDRRRGDSQRPSHRPVARRHLALEPFELRDQLTPARDIRLACVRERHAARRSLDQPKPEPRLDPHHPLADRGGGQPEMGSGGRERTGIGDRHEQMESVRRVRDVGRALLRGHRAGA